MISPCMVLAEFTEQQAANRARVTGEIDRLKRAADTMPRRGSTRGG